jgi:isoleucyl-tRNA synthetase
MREIDRWALAMTREVTRRVVEAYKRFEYTTVYHTLYNYATVTLSAIYIDILKDRLYTFAPKSVGRRSAQSALYEIVDRFARLLAPVLAFTADEIWEALPGRRAPSVHLTEFPEAETREGDKELLARWERLLEIRSVVQKALEEKRNEKVIGASLEAKVTLDATGETLELLRQYEEQLPAIFIVSQVAVEEGGGRDLQVSVGRADGLKCERCWNYSESVGNDARYPTLDERCVRQVEEGWGGI